MNECKLPAKCWCKACKKLYHAARYKKTKAPTVTIEQGLALLKESAPPKTIVFKISSAKVSEQQIKVEEPVEVIEVKKPIDEGFGFPRAICNACLAKNMIGIIYLKDSKRICFICFDTLKKLSGLKLDDIHELELLAVKKHLKPPKEIFR